MRTVHLCQGLAIGGLESVVLDLARHARARGHDDRITLFDADHVDPDRDLDAHGVPVVCVPRRRGIDPGLPLRLARALRDQPTRVLHAHNDTAAFYAACARGLLPARFRPRLVVTFHNLPVHATTRARWATRVACRSAAAVVAVSHDLADRLRASGWAAHAEVVPNGVDLERFAPPAEARPPGPLRIGMIARVAAPKRHDLLIDAVARLGHEGIETDLILVGDGPGRVAVDAALAALPAAQRVRRVDDMPAFLRTLDVAVLLSDHEGAPRSVIEAMACGLPVVASAVGGIPELVGADPAAVLLDNAVDAVASALRALQDRGERRALGARARARAARAFGVDRAAARYDALYAC